MKDDGTTDNEKPDDRRTYSKPRLKRLGKLDEVAKRARTGKNAVPVGRAQYASPS